MCLWSLEKVNLEVLKESISKIGLLNPIPNGLNEFKIYKFFKLTSVKLILIAFLSSLINSCLRAI